MKVATLETLFCDAGWRPWTFLKATTDDGLVGWSEVTDSHGSPRGLAGIVEVLAGADGDVGRAADEGQCGRVEAVDLEPRQTVLREHARHATDSLGRGVEIEVDHRLGLPVCALRERLE